MTTAMVICICVVASLTVLGLFSTIIFGTLLRIKQEETREYRIWVANIWEATMKYIDSWMKQVTEL